MVQTPTLVIGLDGVDFRYLNQFDLPNIEEVRNGGVAAPLQSTHPTWTGSAWPSMYTGVDPSYHGVYDFFDYSDTYPDEADVITRSNVKAPAIWNYLTELDHRSIVLNVPITHPPDEINGILIPGYLAPANSDGHPPNIREEISDELGERYDIYSEFEASDDSDEKIDGYESLIRKRGTAAAHLLQTRDWDFGFVQVQKTDAVFHNSTSLADFRRIYEAADELVGKVIDACDEKPNVILCSDHGIGPVTGKQVYINELLRREGYVEPSSSPTANDLNSIKTNEGGTPETYGSTGAVEQIARVMQLMGITPGRVYQLAQRFGLGDQLKRVVPDSVQDVAQQGVDWRSSRAYCRRPSEQGIRINLEGRDPQGVVPQSQYETIRNDIIDVLSGLTTTDDEPIFEFVCRRDELYEGPYAEDACDILFRTREMNHQVSETLLGETMLSADTFDHKPTGVFIASGPDLRTDWESDDLALTDVAPLVFSLLREPIPDRMTGTVPNELTKTQVTYDSYSNIAIGSDDSYKQDQDEVTERLSDLGYL